MPLRGQPAGEAEAAPHRGTARRAPYAIAWCQIYFSTIISSLAPFAYLHTLYIACHIACRCLSGGCGIMCRPRGSSARHRQMTSITHIARIRHVYASTLDWSFRLFPSGTITNNVFGTHPKIQFVFCLPIRQILTQF